jgi:hypothetical protein
VGPRARRGRARNARRGEGRGGVGEEREGEGTHLGVQIWRSPSPKPRAPRGRERELCAGELNEGKEIRGGGHGIGRGMAPGARGPRLGRAGLHRGSKSRGSHNHRSEYKRETKSETRRSNRCD